MLKHFLFLVLYVALYSFAGGVAMNVALIAHCSMIVYTTFKDRKSINPIVFYSICVAAITLSNILLIFEVNNNNISLYYYIIPAHIDQATLIWCIGNAFIFIGFDLMKNKSLPPVDVEIKSERALKNIFYLILVICLRHFVISDSILGSFSKIFNITSSIGILFFARIWGKTGAKQYRNYTLILFVLQTISAFLFSFLRLELISPSICLFIGYQVGKNDIRSLFSYRIIPYLIGLVIFSQVFVFFGQNRSQFDAGLDRIDQLTSASIATDQVSDKGGVTDRMANLAQITNVVELVDKKGFYDGRASEPLLLALIPRVLWPEKPTIALGAWFAVEIGQGMKTDTWYNNSINMTIQGNLFLDFGWIGLCIGCMFAGMLLALLWNSTRFHNSIYNITGILFGGYLLVICLTGLGADLQILITFIFYYCAFFIIKKIA